MEALILGPGEGRVYRMGRLTAVFKADGDETQDRYALSEWWMEPGFEGVGAHLHAENDEVFHVLTGRAEILLGEVWHPVAAGTLVRIPRGMRHDFRNRSDSRAGLLNVFIPGGFEGAMPAIVQWFRDHPEAG